MRPTTALLTGAALAAALCLASPATAFADGVHEPDGKVSAHEHSDKSDEHEHSDKSEDWKKDEDPAEHHHKHLHGGVHAGGGGLAASGSNLAGGVSLLGGGLGLGAHILRRRQTALNMA